MILKRSLPQLYNLPILNCNLIRLNKLHCKFWLSNLTVLLVDEIAMAVVTTVVDQSSVVKVVIVEMAAVVVQAAVVVRVDMTLVVLLVLAIAIVLQLQLNTRTKSKELLCNSFDCELIHPIA
jgi:hypothetical protein